MSREIPCGDCTICPGCRDWLERFLAEERPPPPSLFAQLLETTLLLAVGLGLGVMLALAILG